MTVNISIIGLGQIGGSMGLALAEQQERVFRIGHDKNHGIARQAEKLGAVDKISINLISAIKDSDLVILALPMDQIKETISYVSKDLKEGAVIIDTAPVKKVVADWCKEMLPYNRYYLGVTPIINGAYLLNSNSGLEEAHDDLFKNGLLAIAAPPDCPSAAIKLVTDLANLIGAEPFYVDLLEIDGLMAATHLLPQLISVSFANATIYQPGWMEARKIAGSFYTDITKPISTFERIPQLYSAILSNKDNVLRVIDNLITDLQYLRDDISQGNEDDLLQKFHNAYLGRKKWWKLRQTSNWLSEDLNNAEAQTFKEMLGRMVGIRKKNRTK